MDKVKKQYTLVILDELFKWYKEKTGKKINDLNKLKVLKLLFLSVGAYEKENDFGNVFKKFKAWSYGPTEIDVYTFLKKLDCIDRYGLNKDIKNIQTKNNTKHIEVKNNVKKTVKRLKSINNDIIKYSPYKLVGITQKWSSWQIANNSINKSIPNELILTDDKYFK